MQSHLDNDACKKCSKVLDLWWRVQTTARREQSYRPPDSAVRSIKGTFAIQGPRRASRNARAIAELLFDSARIPLPVGVRSSGAALRQLLYAAGDYRIDVRIETQADADKVSVVGQVLNSDDPDDLVGMVPVTLVRAGKVLSKSFTSPFGEFDVECDRRGPFELRVTLPTEVLTLPLIQPTSDDRNDSSKTTDTKRLRKRHPRHSKRTGKKV